MIHTYVKVVKSSDGKRSSISGLGPTNSGRDLVQNLLEALCILVITGELSAENDGVVTVSISIGEDVESLDVGLRALLIYNRYIIIRIKIYLDSLVVRKTIFVVRAKIGRRLPVMLSSLIPVLDGLDIDL